ncbi:MAG TPA: DUF3306 domain-containing protein [Telluria sp.]|nr:DUF3306 domain-containing protein [Telluria sp.]
MTERFLTRWSRLKSEGEADPAPAPPEVAAPIAAAPVLAPGADAEAALPTLADVAALNADSDYSAFVARGVDSTVRRLALKKLFADPHFNLVDGLDIYMGDYNKADPIPDAMLAALNCARDFIVKAVDATEPEPAPAPSEQGPA